MDDKIDPPLPTHITRFILTFLKLLIFSERSWIIGIADEINLLNVVIIVGHHF